MISNEIRMKKNCIKIQAKRTQRKGEEGKEGKKNR